MKGFTGLVSIGRELSGLLLRCHLLGIKYGVASMGLPPRLSESNQCF